MFCPKCGTQNPENGKFCRSCGTDLSPVSDALAGKPRNQMQNFGTIEPMSLGNRRGKAPSWEGVLGNFFPGLAFLIIAIVLGVTGVAGGSHWWFWMLIPAFVMMGSGVGQYIQLKKYEQSRRALPSDFPAESNKNFTRAREASALSPTQTAYVAPAETRYRTGDLVPPSVIEDTTKHLEINSEGETMTLPKR